MKIIILASLLNLFLIIAGTLAKDDGNPIKDSMTKLIEQQKSMEQMTVALTGKSDFDIAIKLWMLNSYAIERLDSIHLHSLTVAGAPGIDPGAYNLACDKAAKNFELDIAAIDRFLTVITNHALAEEARSIRALLRESRDLVAKAKKES